jgi:ribosomal protein L7/L12
VPKLVKEGATKEESEKIKAEFEAAGAKVVIK